jgi:hypothetical protein
MIGLLLCDPPPSFVPLEIRIRTFPNLVHLPTMMRPLSLRLPAYYSVNGLTRRTTTVAVIGTFRMTMMNMTISIRQRIRQRIQQRRRRLVKWHEHIPCAMIGLLLWIPAVVVPLEIPIQPRPPAAVRFHPGKIFDATTTPPLL